MSELVLGISADYHDSAAALACDGRPVAAAQKERFTRRHDSAFPARAVAYTLSEAGAAGAGDGIADAGAAKASCRGAAP